MLAKQIKSETQALDTFVRDMEMRLNQAIADYIFLLDLYKALPSSMPRRTTNYWSLNNVGLGALFVLGLILRIVTAPNITLFENKNTQLNMYNIGRTLEHSLAILMVSGLCLMIFLTLFQPRIIEAIIQIGKLPFRDGLIEIRAQLNNWIFLTIYHRQLNHHDLTILDNMDTHWRENLSNDNNLSRLSYLEISEAKKTYYLNDQNFNKFTRENVYNHYVLQLLLLENVLKEVIQNFVNSSTIISKKCFIDLDRVIQNILNDIEETCQHSALNLEFFRDIISFYNHELVATRFMCQDNHDRQYELSSNLTTDLRTIEGLTHFSVFKHWKNGLNCKTADTKIDFTQVDLLFNATKRTSTIAMGNLLGMPKEEIELYCQENFKIA